MSGVATNKALYQFFLTVHVITTPVNNCTLHTVMSHGGHRHADLVAQIGPGVDYYLGGWLRRQLQSAQLRTLVKTESGTLIGAGDGRIHHPDRPQ